MGAILGLGVTHYPPLCGRDEDMARILKRVLQDPGLPEKYRQPSGCPSAMAEEYGADQGLGAARRHLEALVKGFRETRKRLDEVAPGVGLVWGGDQDGKSRKEVTPPFCVRASRPPEPGPWRRRGGRSPGTPGTSRATPPS